MTALFAGDYQYKLSDVVALFDTTAGNRAATLPPAANVPPGTQYVAVNAVGANNVNATAAAGDTVDGAASFAITPAVRASRFASDGVNTWRRIA